MQARSMNHSVRQLASLGPAALFLSITGLQVLRSDKKSHYTHKHSQNGLVLSNICIILWLSDFPSALGLWCPRGQARQIS